MQNVTEIVTAILERDQRLQQLEHLCGTMLATLAISRNRDRLRDGDREAAESLIAISDRWLKEFDRITGRNMADAANTNQPITG